MLTFASWKQRENWRGKLLRISKYPPRFLKKAGLDWGVVRCLIPDWSLVQSYNNRRISQEEYTEAYLRMIHDRWQEVSNWLSSLTAEEDLTLLCHEPDGEFCHRRIVADLIRQHRPDIPIDLR